MPSKTGVSVSPTSVGVLKPNPSALQGQMTREFQVPLSEPQAGFLDVRCRTFTIVGELLWYFCSPVTHPVGIGFEFIVIVPLLLSCCDFHFFFERGVSFSVFQGPTVDSCPTASCSYGAGGGKQTSCYTASLKQKPLK